MEWIVIAIFIVIIFYKVFYKAGNFPFWDILKKWELKEEAYQFFLNNSCWHVVDNIHNWRPPKDNKNWDGPFLFVMASGKTIKVYGKAGEYEKSQNEFLKLIKNREL